MPDWDGYFIQIALAVAQRANCVRGKRPVGAIVVRDKRILSSGYNGTPSGVDNCLTSGCMYCIKTKDALKEHCICVHAEQNAITQAAQFGIPVKGATIFTTVQPCFSCLKEIIQAGMTGVRYLFEYDQFKKPVLYQYKILQAKLSDGVKPVSLPSRKLWENYIQQPLPKAA
jgi:dCMP deaminase